MCRATSLFVFATLFAGVYAAMAANTLAASSSTEILYVAERHSGTTALLTYNVNPETAAATQVGNPTFIGGTNLQPLTIGDEHFVYVWNPTEVWVYRTASNGAPNGQPVQELAFDLPYPVNSFAVDPDGKFAYAVINWTGDFQNYFSTAITLFTIDATTGKLTDTGKVVATYSNSYTSLYNFSFGIKGSLLFGYTYDNGPYTCMPGYDAYPVNQTTGNLGKLITVVQGDANCGISAVTVNDQLTASAWACCGSGSGSLVITKISNGKQVFCENAPTFCLDDAGDITFDPASQNLVYPDTDAKETYIGHIDFANSQLTQSPSTLTGTPLIYFSPDSEVLYAQYKQKVVINAFESSTGYITASTSIAIQGKVTIATTTLQE